MANKGYNNITVASCIVSGLFCLPVKAEIVEIVINVALNLFTRLILFFSALIRPLIDLWKKMSGGDRSTAEWGKSYPKVPVDNIKLDNPFVGKPPFKVTYPWNEPPNINYLLSGEYSRIWNREHDQYLKRRRNKMTVMNKIKPNVNARKPTQKSKQETKEPKAGGQKWKTRKFSE